MGTITLCSLSAQQQELAPYCAVHMRVWGLHVQFFARMAEKRLEVLMRACRRMKLKRNYKFQMYTNPLKGLPTQPTPGSEAALNPHLALPSAQDLTFSIDLNPPCENVVVIVILGSLS